MCGASVCCLPVAAPTLAAAALVALLQMAFEQTPDVAQLLTGQEWRVALAVGRGLSNKAVARDLAVSIKTVEFHLSNVFRKLDITARSQLANLVGRGRLGPATRTLVFVATALDAELTLWERHPQQMPAIAAQIRKLTRHAMAANGGLLVDSSTLGRSMAFTDVGAAVSAAIELQRSVGATTWPIDAPIRLGIGVHVGSAVEHGGRLLGGSIDRAGRIAALASGGDTIVTATTAPLLVDAGWALSPLGLHHVSRGDRTERLFRLEASALGGRPASIPTAPTGLGNLPAVVGELIGRQHELSDLVDRGDRSRLVSVVGAGGVGKTRVALAAARILASQFEDGAWFVDLAAVGEPQAVLAAIASGLEVRVTAAGGVDAVVNALRVQERLIVLDNHDRVVAATAEVVAAITSRCPSVTVLATGRERLGLEGEQIVEVGPLNLDATAGPSDAANLFVYRVSAALGSDEHSLEDAAGIEELVTRLDGLPLAIELAAAQVPTLGLAGVIRRIDDALSMQSRRRDAPDRQRSLHATIDWSYRLLTPDAQNVFAHLCGIAGSFQLSLAVAVAEGVMPVSDIESALTDLVEKSFVMVDRTGGEVRYRVLDVLRQFGTQRLEGIGHVEHVQRAHLAHMLTWLAEAAVGVRSIDEHRWHHAMLADWHNVRAALATAYELGDGDAACRVVMRSLWWIMTRLRMDLDGWPERVLDMPSNADHRLRPVLWSAAALHAHNRGERSAALDHMATARAEEDRLGLAPVPFVPVIGCWIADSDQPIDAARDLRARAAASEEPWWDLLGRIKEGAFYAIAHRYMEVPPQTAAWFAEQILETVDFADNDGNPNARAYSWILQGEIVAICEPAEAVQWFERAIALATPLDVEITLIRARCALAAAYTTLDRPYDALALLAPALHHHIRQGSFVWAWEVLMASLRPLMAVGATELAARVAGALETVAWYQDPDVAAVSADLTAVVGPSNFERWSDEGAALPTASIALETAAMMESLSGDPHS